MKITYPKDVSALLKGVDTLLVVAPARRLARFPSILPEATGRLVRDLAKDASPGDRGAVASSLTGAKPRCLAVGSLPNTVSRYNCEARPECIHRVVAEARLQGGRSGVLIVLEDPTHALPALNAVARAFPLFNARSDRKPEGSLQILAVDPSGAKITIDPIVRATVDATRDAARLVDSPPTDMNPEALVREARKLLKDIPGVRTSVLVGPELLRKKLGGLHAVGRTAKKAPRLFLATFTPPAKGKGKGKGKASRQGKHIALVGKGITYDTGGLSIKGKTAMPTMKADMGGAAATLGAFKVLATTGCKHKVSLLLCLAENAVGPDAYKPDDILTMHSGKTVEINNTDAEGRLVLADGVSYAARVLGAETILDAATLTGAQLVATGYNHAAIFSNSADLEQRVLAAGFSSGDLVHPLMFCPEFYKREFDSKVADMRNSVRDRSNAQASCAAQFIHWHIEDTDAQWCHVDLAGPAFPAGRGTGFGTALLSEAVRRL